MSVIPRSADDDRRDSEVALAYAAAAARAWASRPRPRDIVRVLNVGASWTNRARAVQGDDPLTLAQFVEQLESAVASWLPHGPDAALIENGVATLTCEDLAALADPRSEVEQAIVARIRDGFRERQNGAARYAHIRRFIIEQPVADPDVILDQAREARCRPDELYEEIGADCILDRDGERWFAPCPRCRWPMRRTDRQVQCVGDRCRFLGAVFGWSLGRLRSLGKFDAPELVRCTSQRRLKFGLWRFTVLPGLEELELHAALTRIPQVEVILWPELDRYDLDVRRGRGHWRIEIKDHSSTRWLARDLLARPPSVTTIVAIPDHRRDQPALLRSTCQAIETCRFYSFSEIVEEIRQEPIDG